EQDAEKRQHGRPEPLPRQLAADRRSDDLGAQAPEVPEIRLPERGFDLIGAASQSGPGLAAHLRNADHHLALRRVAVRLDYGVLAAAGKVAVERRADLLDRDRLIELLDDDRAARELDAAGQSFRREGRDPRDDDGPRDGERVVTPPQEVEVGVLEYVHLGI